MIPTITAFADSPDRGEGMARDTRVRWALEEVGQPYEVRLLSFAEMKQPAHCSLQPFGQIPTCEEGPLVLFESGAIILHIASTRPGLFPEDADPRARAITWMFAALGTIEPPMVELEAAMLVEQDKPWFDQRLPLVHERIHGRLAPLSARLGRSDWLEGDFTAGDLMVVEALRRCDRDLLGGYPNLAAYVARAEARPAFGRAFDAQHRVFLETSRD